MPLVSVVIPSYNHGRYLADAIASVLSQTHRDLELIVIDDGSTDGSPDLLRAVRDGRMRYELQENSGAHAAINRGLSLAQGDLLAILNSDDRFEATRLERAATAFADAPDLGLWGSYIKIIDRRGGVLGIKEGPRNLLPVAPTRPERSFQAEPDLRLNLLLSNFWSTTSNFVFRREAFADVGGMAALRFAHDWDFAFRVQRRWPARLEESPLLQYRIHGSNTIHQDRTGMVFEILWVLAQHLPDYLDHPALDVGGAEQTVRRFEQLRHSLQVYGCWRTFGMLQAMLLAARAGSQPLARQLLDRDNPVRQWLLSEIEEELRLAHGVDRERPQSGRSRDWIRGWTWERLSSRS